MVSFTDRNGKIWRIPPERLVAILDCSVELTPGTEGSAVAPACRVYIDGLTPIEVDCDPEEIEVLFDPQAGG